MRLGWLLLGVGVGVVVVFGVGVGVGVVGSVDCCGGDIVVYGRDINVLELRITVRNKRWAMHVTGNCKKPSIGKCRLLYVTC